MQGTALRVWGREIRYERSLFPARITSQGVHLLARPIVLSITADGQRATLSEADVEIVSKRQDQVVLTTSATSGSLRCRTVTTIEFDGMIKITLTVEPLAPTPVDNLRVLIPVQRDVAQIYARYLTYDFTILRTDKMSLETCTQRIEKPIHTGFNPEIWLGNREVGLTWAAETNCQYDLVDEAKTLSVVPGPDSVDLVASIVDHPIVLRQPKTIEFALFPTPLKPVDLRMRQIRLAAGGRFYTAFKAGVSKTVYDYYAIASSRHEVIAPYECLPWSAKTDRHLRIRKQMKDNGVGYIPYGALWYTNAFHPAGRRFYPEWHMLRVSKSSLERWKKYDAGEEQDLQVKAGRHWDGYRVCSSSRSFADFLVRSYVDAIKSDGLDGIYFDHGELSYSCGNPNHDHFKDGTRKQRKLYFGVFAARELLKRLWIAAKAIKPDLIITQHQSRTLKSLNSFIDIAVTGEAMNCLFAGSTTSSAIRKNPSLYKPDYDKIPGLLMQYDYLDTFGFEARILPQVKYAIQAYWADHQTQYDYYSRKMFRHTLLNGTRQWAGNMSQAAINEAWLAMDRMGRLDEGVTFHPYWSNATTVTTKHRDTYASYYRRGNQALLFIGNRGDRDIEGAITLRLGTRIGKAIDAVTGEPVKCTRGRISVTIPAGLYRAVFVSD